MTNNCKCKRIVGPSGVWSLDELKGAEVFIKSIGLGNGHVARGYDAEEKFTIEDILFRISLDGKAITLVKLNNIDATFTLKDLEFVNILDKEEENNDTEG